MAVFFPTSNNKSLTETMTLFWNNLFEFCEDAIISIFGFKLEPPLVIGSIPEDQRDPQMPVKYRLSLHPDFIKNLS